MNNLSFLFAAKTLDQESIKLLDGDLTLYKRPTIHQWQCRFKLAIGAWHSANHAAALGRFETLRVSVNKPYVLPY